MSGFVPACLQYYRITGVRSSEVTAASRQGLRPTHNVGHVCTAVDICGMTRLCLVWLALVGWAVAASYATDDEFASPTPQAWQELLRAQGDTIERLERRLAALENAQSIARQGPPGEPAAPRRSLTEEPTAAAPSTSALVRSYPARRNVEESRLDALEDVAAQIRGLDLLSNHRSADTAFLMVCFVFTLMMTLPGLALFYGGLVRVQNVLAIVMQTFCIACLITILWVAFGYSLSFSKGNGIYGGSSNFWLSSVNTTTTHVTAPTVPEPIFVLFQLSFAIITPAVICGSFADRMRLGPMLLFMAIWHLLVYCPLAHMSWTEGGALHKLGVLDYAGGNVVHIAAGFSGLVASLVIGQRKGFGREAFAAHNMLLSVMGASLLWIGWLSFNAGPAYSAGPAAAQAALNSHLGAATGSMSWMSTEWVLNRRPSVFGIISGALAGLIAVTPGAGYMEHTGAFVASFVSGALCYWTCQLKHVFAFDDALDAFGIHGPAAVVGGIAVGFFANSDVSGNPDIKGCFHGNCRLLGLQLAGILICVTWSTVATFVILKIIDAIFPLRVDEMAEVMGLDLVTHGVQLGSPSNNPSQSGNIGSQDDWLQREIQESQHPDHVTDDWHQEQSKHSASQDVSRCQDGEGPRGITVENDAKAEKTDIGAQMPQSSLRLAEVTALDMQRGVPVHQDPAEPTHGESVSVLTEDGVTRAPDNIYGRLLTGLDGQAHSAPGLVRGGEPGQAAPMRHGQGSPAMGHERGALQSGQAWPNSVQLGQGWRGRFDMNSEEYGDA